MSRSFARSFAAARAGYGAALLWSPGPLTQAAAGHATGPGTRTTARVLGLRHLLQAGITGGDPSPRTLMLGGATDAAHAASMAALAVTGRRWRRAALLDALAAAMLAAAGVRAARRARAGCYCASMGDDWRVCIAFGALPRKLRSCREALIPAVGSRLGDQVTVSSSRTQIFLYAPSIGSADEAAHVAREVLARRNVSASVRTERWSPREQKWRDADEMSADVAAERQAVHEYRQEQERERSATSGSPAWQVRVDVLSHRDAVALAGHLAAQGWRVRPRRKSLIVWADCEDDAKGLARALRGDGRADADTAFRVRRVSTINNAYAPSFPSGP